MHSAGTRSDYVYLEGRLFARIDNNGTTDSYYYYHTDHLGTPLAISDQNGAVVWSAAYKAFGEAQVAATSSIVNNIRFPGQSLIETRHFIIAISQLVIKFFRVHTVHQLPVPSDSVLSCPSCGCQRS